MDKQGVYQFLSSQHIPYEVTEHSAVTTMDELPDVRLPYPEAEAKNLFIRDDKKQHYGLITVRGSKRVDLKAFRREHGLRALSFASEAHLLRLLALRPGSVTPFGLLNDTACQVHFWLDESFTGKLIGVHPNENTATVWLQADTLVRIITQHGNPVHLVPVHSAGS